MKYDKEEKELLDLYESGEMTLSKPSKKELAAIRAAADDTFKKDKRITINFQNDLEPGKNQLFGKENQLKHLFLKLFGNAFDAIEKEGSLSILVRNGGREIEIAISDTGDLHDGQTLWRNACVSEANSTEDEGQILDLSICYNIVQHHKGEIKFSSLGEQGKITMIKFPLLQPGREQPLIS